jgi:GldM N-terminal domain
LARWDFGKKCKKSRELLVLSREKYNYLTSVSFSWHRRLRRTLNLPVQYSSKEISSMKEVVFISIVFTMLISCNNNHSASEQVLKDFDSVNKSLENTNEKIPISTSTLYAEFEKKFAINDSFGRISLMQPTFQDFYEFMSGLKRKFIIICGDSSGTAVPIQSEAKLSLTNSFFFQKKSEAMYLFGRLKEVQNYLKAIAIDSLLKDEIKVWNTFKLIEEPGGNESSKFMKVHFYNIPPVAAITILSKFENDIKNFENKVLSNCLKQ